MSYFKEEYIVNISSLINNEINFYAHLKNDRKETLQEHTDLCNKYFFRMDKSKNLGGIFENFENHFLGILDKKDIILFRRLVINTINFHDIGKINPLFQKNRMENVIIDKCIESSINSKHSILSSILYIDFFIDEVNKLKEIDKDTYRLISQILFINAYIISRHHSKLNDFEEFKNSFTVEMDGEADKAITFIREHCKFAYKKEVGLKSKIILKKCRNSINYLKGGIKENNIYVYIYAKLLYSLLVACDFYATTEFINGVELNEFGEIGDISDFYNIYKKSEVYKSIREYEKTKYKNDKNLLIEKNINILRSEMFLDAEKKLSENLEKDIFFLEAPTGSGKSNVSINLSFKLLENNKSMKKIYYIYPFNTLIEQNIKSLEKIFEIYNKYSKSVLENIAVINSITPIKLEKNILENEEKTDEIEYKYYASALLNRQFLNYPMILSTHVSLFNTMFNSSKESAFSFHQLANSVIVLDEIQSYKNTIWSEIITFLKGFAKILNMKVIIMSATLPELNYLTNSCENTINLIDHREKYFSNPLFRNRVNINYELIDKEIDTVYEHVKSMCKKNKKILIEFIKKQSAYNFYNSLQEDDDVTSKVELLTGDDNIVERQRILGIISESDDIILVATQVIEAGVDIDMDIGYKDISKLDSEEQFMGRINRSCKRKGVVYFFNIDNADIIYKNDIRINKEFTLVNQTMKEILVSKDFKRYYHPVLNALKSNYNESLSESNLDEFFSNCVGVLKFEKVEDRMKLIEEDMWSMSIFLSRVIELEDGIVLDGNKVWNNYKELLANSKLEYAEKEVKLSKARSLLNYFIYQIKKCDLVYNDRIGDLYFIEDGKTYFKDNKIDKNKLITGIGDFI